MSTMQSPAFVQEICMFICPIYIQVNTMLYSGPVMIITAECVTFTLK